MYWSYWIKIFNDFHGIIKSIKITMYWIMTFKESIKVIMYSIKALKMFIKINMYSIITFINSINVTPRSWGSVDYPSTRGILVNVG